MIYDILPVNNYCGNNSSNIFDFDFYIENANQLNVFHFDKNGLKNKLVYNLDYSINEFKNKNGGFITFPISGSEYNILSSEEKISLELTLPIAQETQYNNSSLLNLEALEYSLDYLTRLIQIYSRKFDLCVKVDECSSIAPDELMQELNNKVVLSAKNADITENYANIVDEKYNNVINIAQQIQENSDKFDKIDDIELNKANIDCSNLDSSIKQFDSQWVSLNNIRALEWTNITSASPLEIDLSSYIPDDGYDYLVSAHMNFNGTTLNYCTMYGTGTAFTGTLSLSVFNQVANTTISARGLVYVDTNRKIHIATGAASGSKTSCALLGYRRIGTNQ